MPSLFEIEKENEVPSIIKRYIKKLHDKTKRNVIIYYSGWLTAPNECPVTINDMDKNGFMAMCHELDVSKGLDLILHTPGGDVAATESIIDYLNNIFNGNIRAIIPQLAMSAGTMIACSCKEIVMGKQSSLGPVDPQMNNLPAHGVISEFNLMKKEMKKDPSTIPLWQPILAKYNPTFIGSCQRAIEWSDEILEYSLKNNMFKDDVNCDEKIKKIKAVLGSPKDTKHHNRHLNPNRCKDLGLNISFMEDNQEEQDLILSIHHACISLFNKSNIFKIFANSNDKFLNFKFNIN